MTNPRGDSGSVRGIPPERVSELLLAAIDEVGPDLIGRTKVGGTFRWSEARDFFAQERWGLDDAEVKGMVDALVGLPGTQRVSRGEYRLHWRAHLYARFRTWRLPRSPLDLHQAYELRSRISKSEPLEEEARRLDQALALVEATAGMEEGA